MMNANQVMEMLDDFEKEEGAFLRDQSQQLTRAAYHQSALTEALEKFKTENDPDETQYLREKIQFHRDRLRLILGND
jgi:hypothetical protein